MKFEEITDNSAVYGHAYNYVVIEGSPRLSSTNNSFSNTYEVISKVLVCLKTLEKHYKTSHFLSS